MNILGIFKKCKIHLWFWLQPCARSFCFFSTPNLEFLHRRKIPAKEIPSKSLGWGKEREGLGFLSLEGCWRSFWGFFWWCLGRIFRLGYPCLVLGFWEGWQGFGEERQSFWEERRFLGGMRRFLGEIRFWGEMRRFLRGMKILGRNEKIFRKTEKVFERIEKVFLRNEKIFRRIGKVFRRNNEVFLGGMRRFWEKWEYF